MELVQHSLAGIGYSLFSQKNFSLKAQHILVRFGFKVVLLEPGVWCIGRNKLSHMAVAYQGKELNE